MKIIFDISTDNDAFRDNPEFEIRRIVHDALQKVSMIQADIRPLFDVNGNKCGTVQVKTRSRKI